MPAHEQDVPVLMARVHAEMTTGPPRARPLSPAPILEERLTRLVQVLFLEARLNS